MKLRHLEEVKRKRAFEEDEETQVTTVPMKKRGRPLLIGETLYEMVQLYLKKVRQMDQLQL